MDDAERLMFQAWSKRPQFRAKVDQAISVIKQALAIAPAYVACSWGKDSTVLLHLAQQVQPNIPAISFDNSDWRSSMPDLCYLCGKTATYPLIVKDTFTAHSTCKVPTSDKMCGRCQYAINTRYWYFNEAKQSWSAIYFRGVSSLWLGDKLSCPPVTEARTETAGKQGSFTLPVVSSLPTRAQMRDWLLDPPEPPFTIAIAESGQKHILPWAQEGHSRDYFPVQFELDSLWIDRAQFTTLLGHYETLMGLGFSKTEIDSGQYHSDRLMAAILTYGPHDAAIEPHRGTRLLALCSHVAQKPAETALVYQEFLAEAQSSDAIRGLLNG